MKSLKFLLLLILHIHASAFAGDIKRNFEVKVAVVDVQSILESSIAISGIRKSIEDISRDIQKYVTSKEVEFKVIEEEITKKRSHLTDQAFEKEVNNFEEKVNNAKKVIQERKSKLEQAHAGAVAKVHEVTMEIIHEIAKKYNFNLALPSSQVLFASSDLNITAEVITLLNSRLKSVKVNY